MQYDVFMSHASEDKESIARPLTGALEARGLRVWFDNQEILIGDRIRQKIEEGLAQSRYGVVILSKPFISKFWTNFELDGLIERVLPVWHEIDREEIASRFPALAGIAALNTSEHDVLDIARQIDEKVRGKTDLNAMQSGRQSAPQAASGFAVFYVAPAYTEELTEEKKSQRFIEAEPTGIKPHQWISLIYSPPEKKDGTVKYEIDDNKLHIYIDSNHVMLAGEEGTVAYHLISGNQPFALVLRPEGKEQQYFPSVVNTSPGKSILLQHGNSSGWMDFEI